MNAKEFKATALKCSDHYSVDFCTKKEMLDWCTDCDGNVCVLDNDTHVHAWVGNEFFSDERVTKAILRKADYIELSHTEGWMWYIGRNCAESVLDEAYEATVGFYIEELEEIA